MPKLIIPKTLYFLDGYNLRATSDIDFKNALKALQNPLAQYELDLKNNRSYVNIKTDFFDKFKVANELTINLENIDYAYVKLFDYFLFPEKHAAFVDVPNLIIKVNKHIAIQSSHLSKQASLANTSCLKNLTLAAATFTINLNSFHNLEKFKTQESPAQMKPDEYSANQFKFVNCESLKEIDISSVEDYGNYCHMFLSKIPDDCQIKFNKKMWENVKNIVIDKNKKDTIDFWLFNDRQDYYFYNKDKSCKVNLADYVQADTDPIVVTFGKLKKIIDKIQKSHAPMEEKIVR